MSSKPNDQAEAPKAQGTIDQGLTLPSPDLTSSSMHRLRKHCRYCCDFYKVHTHVHEHDCPTHGPSRNPHICKDSIPEKTNQSSEQTSGEDLSSWSHITMSRKGALISSVSTEDEFHQRKGPFYMHTNIPRVDEPSVKIFKESVAAIEDGGVDVEGVKGSEKDGRKGLKGGEKQGEDDGWDLV